MLSAVTKDGFLAKNTEGEVYRQVMSVKGDTPIEAVESPMLLQIYRSLAYMLIMEAFQLERLQNQPATMALAK
jgi:hypothetical protein